MSAPDHVIRAVVLDILEWRERKAARELLAAMWAREAGLKVDAPPPLVIEARRPS